VAERHFLAGIATASAAFSSLVIVALWMTTWFVPLMLELILIAAAALYALGVAALWRNAGRGRGIREGHAVRFAAGWIVARGSARFAARRGSGALLRTAHGASTSS
jgi:hypothetical protein